MDASNNITDTTTLSVPHAWYSRSINDFVDLTNTEYAHNTDLDIQPWLSNRIIGLKNYELTNHLGNVQATVLDRYTALTKSTTDTAYNLWRANISTAVDHYPFGSPMPGRITNDTVSQSLMTNVAVNNAHTMVIDDVPANTNHFTWTPYGPGSAVTFLNAPQRVKTELVCFGPPVGYMNDYGVDLAINNLVPNDDYTIKLKYDNPGGVPETVKLEEITYVGNQPVPSVTSSSSNATDWLSINFTADGTGSKLFHLVYNYCGNPITIDSIELSKDTIAVTYVSKLLKSTTTPDDYRFGFNGQEKDNEIKGIGNSNTAQFWQYDTRLGRRWNLDPVDQVNVSNYAAFLNNPIFYTDHLGNTAKGVNKKDAERTKETIDQTFSDDKYADLRGLFSIGKDGKTFNKIDENNFEKITSKIEDQDILSLAIGYKNKINDDWVYNIEAVKLGEPLSEFAYENGMKYADGTALDEAGGGASKDMAALGQSLVVFVVNSKFLVDKSTESYMLPLTRSYVSKVASAGELLAHELIGHNGGSRNTDLRSLQVDNIYLRSQKAGYIRTGKNHGPEGGPGGWRGVHNVPTDLRSWRSWFFHQTRRR